MKVRVFRLAWPNEPPIVMAGPDMIPAECGAIYDTAGATITEYEGELTLGKKVGL